MTHKATNKSRRGLEHKDTKQGQHVNRIQTRQSSAKLGIGKVAGSQRRGVRPCSAAGCAASAPGCRGRVAAKVRGLHPCFCSGPEPASRSNRVCGPLVPLRASKPCQASRATVALSVSRTRQQGASGSRRQMQVIQKGKELRLQGDKRLRRFGPRGLTACQRFTADPDLAQHIVCQLSLSAYSRCFRLRPGACMNVPAFPLITQKHVFGTQPPGLADISAADVWRGNAPLPEAEQGITVLGASLAHGRKCIRASPARRSAQQTTSPPAGPPDSSWPAGEWLLLLTARRHGPTMHFVSYPQHSPIFLP